MGCILIQNQGTVLVLTDTNVDKTSVDNFIVMFKMEWIQTLIFNDTIKNGKLIINQKCVIVLFTN